MYTDYPCEFDTSSRKFECPQCGKKTFVLYVDIDSEDYLPEIYGKCDRAVKCGYFCDPYSEGYVQDKYRKQQNHDYKRHIQVVSAKPPLRQKIDIPAEVLKASLCGYEQNKFIQFLLSFLPKEVVKQLIERYYIGSSDKWGGATTFWFINYKGQIRAGQVKLFDGYGHTAKYIDRESNQRSCTTWTHSVLSYQYEKQGQEVPGWLKAYKKQEKRVDCLFGEHLLKDDLTKPIALFESPKTAIIASAFFPGYICLATGSISYLTEDRLQALKGRNVVLYPDLSVDGKAFEQWAKKANTLAELATFRVSEVLEKHAMDQEREQGLDMADYLVGLNYLDFIGAPAERVAPPPLEPVEQAQNLVEEDTLPTLLPGIHTVINGEGTTYELEINKFGYPAIFDTASIILNLF